MVPRDRNGLVHHRRERNDDRWERNDDHRHRHFHHRRLFHHRWRDDDHRHFTTGSATTTTGGTPGAAGARGRRCSGLWRRCRRRRVRRWAEAWAEPAERARREVLSRAVWGPPSLQRPASRRTRVVSSAFTGRDGRSRLLTNVHRRRQCSVNVCSAANQSASALLCARKCGRAVRGVGDGAGGRRRPRPRGRRAPRGRVPRARRVPDREPVAGLDSLLLKGTIDLWLPRPPGPEGAGGVVLLDHKTNSPRGRLKSVDDLAAHYAPQLRLYALAAERITGRAPVAAGLLLLDPEWGRRGAAVEVAVDVSGDALLDARRLCRAYAISCLTDRWPLTWREALNFVPDAKLRDTLAVS